MFSPIGPDGYPRRVCDRLTGEIDHGTEGRHANRRVKILATAARDGIESSTREFSLQPAARRLALEVIPEGELPGARPDRHVVVTQNAFLDVDHAIVVEHVAACDRRSPAIALDLQPEIQHVVRVHALA